jgi:DNA modification methylase
MQKIPIHQWEGCYSKSWNGLIVDEAFKHPAKYSRSLIEKIFDHMEASGWIQPGESVKVTESIKSLILSDVSNGRYILFREWIPASPQEKSQITKDLSVLPRSGSAETMDPEHGSKQPSLTNGARGQSSSLSSAAASQSQKDLSFTTSTKTQLTTESKISPLSSERPIPPAIAKSLQKRKKVKSCPKEISSAQTAKASTKENTSEQTACATDADQNPEVTPAVVTNSGYVVKLNALPKVGEQVFRRGSIIGDCFGGVGLGGVIAAYRKYLWFGMEIEPRFVEFGNKNFQLHKRRWKDAVLGDACLVLGDSRQFAKGINYMSAVVTSPPYAQSIRGLEQNGIDVEKMNAKNNHAGKNSMAGSKEIYGKSPGQIDRLREGQIETLPTGSVDAVITSPPYADIAAGQGGLNSKPAKKPGQQAGRSAKSASQTADQKYGTAEGQIARLPKTDVDAVITSPPWEANAEGGIKAHKMKFVPDNGKGHYATPAAKARAMTKEEGRIYGTAEGQIGNDKGEDYWQAMSKVYASCFEALKPGGVAAIVIKDYVKNKKRVLLCDDTCRLLEHLGFVMIERIHALLVKETKTADLFEGETTKRTEKKSFFRRLHEKKPGAVRIDWEEVLICQKPYETAFS